LSIEHCDFLSWFSRKRESHKQDGETLTARSEAAMPYQRPAILPWLSDLHRIQTGFGPFDKAAASLPGNGGRLMRSADKRAGRPRARIC
jgi:hypothetical protein